MRASDDYMWHWEDEHWNQRRIYGALGRWALKIATHELINDISGRNGAIKQTESQLPEERVKLWYTHFSNLLGSLPKISEEDTPILIAFDALDILEEPFSYEEFLQAEKAIRCWKACGDDSITTEFLKYGVLDDIVLGLSSIHDWSHTWVI